MAAMRVSNVRAAALRNRCFNLAKTCSIGFRSGEYLGRKNSLAPADRIARRMVARRKRRCQHLLDVGFEAFAVDRTHRSHRAPRCDQPKGATKVRVFQWPCGTLA